MTELIPELLDLVDKKKLQFTVAIDISYIDKEVQEWIYEYISDTGFIKPKQIAALRNQLNDGPINQIQMLSIFNNCVIAKKVSRSLTFSEKKLTKYFPDDYTAKDMEQVIEQLMPASLALFLKNWLTLAISRYPPDQELGKRISLGRPHLYQYSVRRSKFF